MKHIISAGCSLGQKNLGTKIAPLFFKITDSIKMDSLYDYQHLYNKIKNIDYNDRIVTIGGDHSIGVSTVSAINDRCIKNNKILSILWIDAHADINTFETSISQNTHGMVVAFLLNLCKFNYI